MVDRVIGKGMGCMVYAVHSVCCSFLRILALHPLPGLTSGISLHMVGSLSSTSISIDVCTLTEQASWTLLCLPRCASMGCRL